MVTEPERQRLDGELVSLARNLHIEVNDRKSLVAGH